MQTSHRLQENRKRKPGHDAGSLFGGFNAELALVCNTIFLLWFLCA